MLIYFFSVGAKGFASYADIHLNVHRPKRLYIFPKSPKMKLLRMLLPYILESTAIHDNDLCTWRSICRSPGEL